MSRTQLSDSPKFMCLTPITVSREQVYALCCLQTSPWTTRAAQIPTGRWLHHRGEPISQSISFMLQDSIPVPDGVSPHGGDKEVPWSTFPTRTHPLPSGAEAPYPPKDSIHQQITHGPADAGGSVLPKQQHRDGAKYVSNLHLWVHWGCPGVPTGYWPLETGARDGSTVCRQQFPETLFPAD